MSKPGLNFACLHCGFTAAEDEFHQRRPQMAALCPKCGSYKIRPREPGATTGITTLPCSSWTEIMRELQCRPVMRWYALAAVLFGIAIALLIFWPYKPNP